jgi:HEAT repeat protein
MSLYYSVRRKFGDDRLKALLTSKEHKILPALKDALHDKDIFVTFAAASELIALGDTSHTTISVLLDMFRKRNIKKWKTQFIPRPDIPAEDQPKLKEKQKQDAAALPADALEILKKVRSQFVVAGLNEALEDEDSWVRLQAKKALEEIKGEDQRRQED